jgi:hypothetical protein
MSYLLAIAILAAGPVRSGEAPRLSPGSAVCVNPVLNLALRGFDAEGVTEQLAARIREAGFASGSLGTLPRCDATVFTEIVAVSGRKRKSVETEFRIVLSGEQIPRLCSSARGKSTEAQSAAVRGALLQALHDEARQIRAAQAKGMALYHGAIE